MSLVWNLARHSPYLFAVSILINAVSAIAGMAAIACIFYATDVYYHTFTLFIFFSVASIVARFSADYLISIIGRTFIAGIKIELTEGLINTKLTTIEKIGLSHLTTAFILDISKIGAAVSGILVALSNTFIAVACLVYLFYLSWAASVFVTISIPVGVALYYVLSQRGGRNIFKTIQHVELLNNLFASIVQGISQVKLVRAARERVRSDSYKEVAHIDASYSVGYRWFSLSERAIQLLSYTILGATAFLIMSQSPQAAILQYCIVLIYLFGPLLSIVQILPNVVEADVALARVKNIAQPLSQVGRPDGISRKQPNLDGTFELSFESVSYLYESEPSTLQSKFAINGMSFKVRSGEIVFIVGGNGSGKTTTAKLLTGLYSPNSGEVRLNGILIQNDNLSWYSEHFCATFQDHVLFEWMIPAVAAHDPIKADEWLRRLDLVDRFDLSKVTNETLAQLSIGERRRVALLISILNDRPVYVFDEWAADQQPEMRTYFYEVVIEELRASGKLVVVITHDDRYFGKADKVMRLERGKPPLVAHNTVLA